jgi:hypothetical protein
MTHDRRPRPGTMASLRVGGVGHSGDGGVEAPVGQEAGEGVVGVNDLGDGARLGRIEN